MIVHVLTDSQKAPTVTEEDYLQHLYDQVDNLYVDENDDFEEAVTKSKLLLASRQASKREAIEMKPKEAENGRSY